jgi:hypothetical protein
MLVKTEDEIEKVLAEAESIKAGIDPAVATASVGEGPATHADGTEGEVVTPDASPSASFEQLAGLMCLLCDWPFVRMFGAQGQLPDPFRSEAQKAWAEIMETYLPAVVAKAGPFGVLLSLYSMHGAGLYLSCQMNASASASSAKEAPANQP